MMEHVYKHIELTGTSKSSLEEAITRAVTQAAKTVRNMKWFQVLDTRGAISGGAVSEWQVTLKIGFTIE